MPIKRKNTYGPMKKKAPPISPNFDNNGECWLYILNESHAEGIKPEEVIKLKPELERFAKTNPGFQQFETRYRQAIATPDVIDEVRRYESERMRQEGMLKAARRQGEETGRKLGEEIGREQGESRFIALMSAMTDAGRTADFERLLTDKSYRESLYAEFDL